MKRFAASGTAFARKYREDLFFRTTANVVALQTGFALFLLVLVAVGGTILYQSVIETITASIRQSLDAGSAPANGLALISNLEYVRATTLVVIGTLVLIGAAIFSYLIARLALAPTRSALESQKQFVSNVAHELRTPLSIIKTNAEVALFTEPEGRMRTMLLGTVDELDRISNIINNLLSLSAVVRPDRMKFTAIALEDAVRHAVESLSDLAERKSVPVRLTVADGIPPVRGNRSAIEQIVMNLLKNAINYTREKGPAVEVRIGRFGSDHVALTIADEGAGIPESDLPRVLEPFFRGDPARTRKSSGSGLGLTIVNELLKLHEGKMRIKSVLGRGTEVEVMLPTMSGVVELSKTAEPSEVSVDFSKASA